VALLSIIRRWHIRDQVPLREIARRLRISRNTVRRYLRAEITEPAYAVRRSRSAIDKYAFQLSAMLKTEAARSRKQRRTLKQIHEDLKELGFEGSYDRVAAFARVWREGQTERVNPSSKRTRCQHLLRKDSSYLVRRDESQSPLGHARGTHACCQRKSRGR
jgi:AraC-like DNA-binding protein